MRLMGLLFRQFYHYADISRLVKLYASHTQQHLEVAMVTALSHENSKPNCIIRWNITDTPIHRKSQ